MKGLFISKDRQEELTNWINGIPTKYGVQLFGFLNTCAEEQRLAEEALLETQSDKKETNTEEKV